MSDTGISSFMVNMFCFCSGGPIVSITMRIYGNIWAVSTFIVENFPHYELEIVDSYPQGIFSTGPRVTKKSQNRRSRDLDEIV